VKTWLGKPQSKKEYDQNNLGQNNSDKTQRLFTTLRGNFWTGLQNRQDGFKWKRRIRLISSSSLRDWYDTPTAHTRSSLMILLSMILRDFPLAHPIHTHLV
jgi:hypothetical protein